LNKKPTPLSIICGTFLHIRHDALISIVFVSLFVCHLCRYKSVCVFLNACGRSSFQIGLEKAEPWPIGVTKFRRPFLGNLALFGYSILPCPKFGQFNSILGRNNQTCIKLQDKSLSVRDIQ
jgi:hypothetical protein